MANNTTLSDEELVKRNKEMTVLVMKGYALAAVGKIFKITGVRVRDIVLREAHRVLGLKKIKDEQYSCPWITVYPHGIMGLRKKYKYRLIARLSEE
jgi:hypothetical protein